MKIDELARQLSIDANIFFHKFEQQNDVIIAKSHFFDIHFGPTYIEVVDSYNLPGPRLETYMKQVLPFRIDYVVDNYYNILLNTLVEIHEYCVACEYRDEREEE